MSAVAIVVSDEGLGGVVPFGRGLAELGVEPVLLTGEVAESRLGEWRQVYSRVDRLADPYDPEALVDGAERAAAGRPIAALFSCYDGLVLPAAHAAAALGLPHPDLAGLARARNKLATRLATLRQGIATPRFAPIRDREDCADAGLDVGFPAVLKPLNGMASHLVKRVDDLPSLQSTYDRSVACLGSSFAGNYRSGLPGRPAEEGSDLDPRRTFLCEQWLPGSEHSAEVLVRDGVIHRIALFHKFMIDPRGFLECGFTRPSFGCEPREEEIWQHVELCLRALGVDQAAAHVEVLDTPEGPRLIEINAGRAGGQILVLAVREATGVDLIAEILALQLGRPRPEPGVVAWQGRATTLTVFPPTSGRLTALDGLDGVAALPGVVRVLPFCAPGDVLDVADKELFAVNLLVHGGDEEDLRALHAEACSRVGFRFATPESAPGRPTPLPLAGEEKAGKEEAGEEEAGEEEGRPAAREGQNRFVPDTRMVDLLAGRVADGARIRIAGRLHLGTEGSSTLRDGEQELAVRLANGALTAREEGAWAGVEGRWVAASPSLVEAEVLFLRRNHWNAREARRRGIPEGDFVADPSRLGGFRARARLLSWLRSFCAERGYLEVQTPLLRTGAEAANVEQYRLAALEGRRFYLRTDPEEYLKRYLTAGLDAVYEISTNVRGEAPDADHLHEFTSLECYRRFSTFDETLALTTELVRGALENLRGSLETRLHGRPVSFESPPEVRTFSSLLEEHAGILPAAFPTAESLAAAIRRQRWWTGERPPLSSLRGAWLEWLFERRALPALERPTYVIEFPREIGISALPHPDRPEVCLRGELYLQGGWELVHLYENLTQPGALRQRLIARLHRRVESGFPGAPLDAGLLGSAELGMPPMAGLAIGVDRLLLLIRGQGDLGQGLLFPREGFDGSGA